MTDRDNYDVFLSFSSKDMDKVTPIANSLRGSGMSVYNYEWEKPGEIWPKEIQSALNNSKSYLCLLSDNFLREARSWTMSELTMAQIIYHERGPEFMILPVISPEIPVTRIPLFLRQFRCFDYDPVNTPAEIVRRLREVRQPDLHNSLIVAVCAMNRGEAEDVLTRGIRDEEFGEEFSTFLAALRRRSHTLNISTLKRSYGNAREDWIPAFCQHSLPQSISGIIHNIVNKLQKDKTNDFPDLSPYFVSDIVFPEEHGQRIDPRERARFLYTLKRGAVLIVDAISLFHPHLRRTLLESGLATHNPISIIIVYPFGLEHSQLHKELVPLVESKLQDARIRFSDDLLLDCELGIGDLDPLRRWLYTVLPQIPVRRAGPREENLNKMNEQYPGMSTIGDKIFRS
jgi:hypothetical protein